MCAAEKLTEVHAGCGNTQYTVFTQDKNTKQFVDCCEDLDVTAEQLPSATKTASVSSSFSDTVMDCVRITNCSVHREEGEKTPTQINQSLY